MRLGLVNAVRNARLRLRRDGEIAFTLSQQRVVATDFGDVFAVVPG